MAGEAGRRVCRLRSGPRTGPPVRGVHVARTPVQKQREAVRCRWSMPDEPGGVSSATSAGEGAQLPKRAKTRKTGCVLPSAREQKNNSKLHRSTQRKTGGRTSLPDLIVSLAGLRPQAPTVSALFSIIRICSTAL